MIAAFAFLAAYSIPIMWPGVSDGIRLACVVTLVVVWGLFTVDYAVRLRLAPAPVAYLKAHLLDLVVIILPFLRFLRVVRILEFLTTTSSTKVRAKLVSYVVAAACLFGFVGALMVLNAERGTPDSNIETVGDALWWAVVTMTTTGFGDRYPVTGMGRLGGVVLMIGGTIIVGTVTATLFSWMSERIKHDVKAAKSL